MSSIQYMNILSCKKMYKRIIDCEGSDNKIVIEQTII